MNPSSVIPGALVRKKIPARPIERKIAFAMILAGAVVLLLVIFSYRNSRSFSEAVQSVAHTQEVLKRA